MSVGFSSYDGEENLRGTVTTKFMDSDRSVMKKRMIG